MNNNQTSNIQSESKTNLQNGFRAPTKINLETADLSQKIQQKLENKTVSNGYYQSPWNYVLILFLFASLVFSGGFSLYQYQNYQEELSRIENRGVLPASESLDQTIIAGANFSLVLETAEVDGFEEKQETVEMGILDNSTGVSYSYLKNTDYQGKSLISGLEVASVQYDNRYSQSNFASLVAKDMDLQVGGLINIPKNLQLTKLNGYKEGENIDIYTAVTSNNYYIIKVFNQTSGIPEFQELATYVDFMVAGLHLN